MFVYQDRVENDRIAVSCDLRFLLSYLASKLMTWFNARMNPMADPDIPICLTITGKNGRMGEPPGNQVNHFLNFLHFYDILFF